MKNDNGYFILFFWIVLGCYHNIQAEQMETPLILNEQRIQALLDSPLQKMIDEAPEGAVITPTAGIYSGPIVINKAITLDGKNKVTITGVGKHHAIAIYGNGAIVKNLHLTNTGESTEREDACVLIEQGNQNIIQDNIMTDCFFGVDLKKADGNKIINNNILGKEINLGLRGDGIRLWYSMKNEIINNHIRKFKDMVVWYSHDNIIQNNTVSECRYSIHFMFSQYNLVDANKFIGNAVGVYIMYTEGVEIKNNYIANSNGPTGMAIGFKEASNVKVFGNDILYCAIGIGVDLSPFQPDSSVILQANRISYNSVGLQFNSKLKGVIIKENIFEGNIDHLSVSQNESAAENQFEGNYWDTYEGFDQNHDGVGDKTYEMYSFVDKIWMEIPIARFFKNSPLMEFVDFLEQLAPFSSPTLMMKDEKPIVDKNILLKEKNETKVGANG